VTETSKTHVLLCGPRRGVRVGVGTPHGFDGRRLLIVRAAVVPAIWTNDLVRAGGSVDHPGSLAVGPRHLCWLGPDFD
jgi:hypothetical protein